MSSLATLAATLERPGRRATTIDDLAREIGLSRSEVELGLLLLERLGRVRRESAGVDCAPGSAACGGCLVRAPCQSTRGLIASFGPVQPTVVERTANVQP